MNIKEAVRATLKEYADGIKSAIVQRAKSGVIIRFSVSMFPLFVAAGLVLSPIFSMRWVAGGTLSKGSEPPNLSNVAPVRKISGQRKGMVHV